MARLKSVMTSCASRLMMTSVLAFRLCDVDRVLPLTETRIAKFRGTKMQPALGQRGWSRRRHTTLP
jgi:hypothetical protein